MDSIWLTIAEISLLIGSGCFGLMWLFAGDIHHLRRELDRKDALLEDVGHAASVLGRHNAATAKAKRAAFHTPMMAAFLPGRSL